jgi:hypothetical protein
MHCIFGRMENPRETVLKIYPFQKCIFKCIFGKESK